MVWPWCVMVKRGPLPQTVLIPSSTQYILFSPPPPSLTQCVGCFRIAGALMVETAVVVAFYRGSGTSFGMGMLNDRVLLD